jgi:hypothetical protein
MVAAGVMVAVGAASTLLGEGVKVGETGFRPVPHPFNKSVRTTSARETDGIVFFISLSI